MGAVVRVLRGIGRGVRARLKVFAAVALGVPAVSLAIAKRAGTNAVVISENIIERLERLKDADAVVRDLTCLTVERLEEVLD